MFFVWLPRPKIAPDVLRQLAQTFCDEEDIVKLQILNLASKLYLTNQDGKGKKPTRLLLKYVLNTRTPFIVQCGGNSSALYCATWG